MSCNNHLFQPEIMQNAGSKYMMEGGVYKTKEKMWNFET